MGETPTQRQYRDDALVLGELGWHLPNSKLPRVTVRLPRALAEKAVAAWERENEGEPDPEDYGQRAQRHRAATLALIGLSITNDGEWTDDEVEVPLDPSFIGIAVDAADDLPTR